MSIFSFKNDRIGDMSVLAIKGDVNNGNEVICILEMLGCINVKGYEGNEENKIYFDNWGAIECTDKTEEWMDVFTLEEYNQRYPYRLNDIVMFEKTKSDEQYGHFQIVNIKYDDYYGCLVSTLERMVLNETEKTFTPASSDSPFRRHIVYHNTEEKVLKVVREDNSYRKEVEITKACYNCGKLHNKEQTICDVCGKEIDKTFKKN